MMLRDRAARRAASASDRPPAPRHDGTPPPGAENLTHKGRLTRLVKAAPGAARCYPRSHALKPEEPAGIEAMLRDVATHHAVALLLRLHAGLRPDGTGVALSACEPALLTACLAIAKRWADQLCATGPSKTPPSPSRDVITVGGAEWRVLTEAGGTVDELFKAAVALPTGAGAGAGAAGSPSEASLRSQLDEIMAALSSHDIHSHAR